MKMHKQTSWRVEYQNKNSDLTQAFYSVCESYESDKVKIALKSFDVIDEPSCFYILGDLGNIDVILFFKQIFKDHPEFKSGCIHFKAASEITIVEYIDMSPLLEIF